MTYLVLITADFSQQINGQTVYFKVNTTYDLVEAYREVLESGLINVYNAATVNDEEVNLPEDYTCIIPETDVPTYANEVAKYVGELSDTTTDYHVAYQDRLGITINHLADVDKDSWIDPRTETRTDPDE